MKADELFGFLSTEELATAIAAWREMEKRVRGMYGYGVRSWLLEPVDALDNAAGMKAIGIGKDDE